jgi:hypothetical protein
MVKFVGFFVICCFVVLASDLVSAQTTIQVAAAVRPRPIPVPEPASALLLGVGVLAMRAIQYFRRAAN